MKRLTGIAFAVLVFSAAAPAFEWVSVGNPVISYPGYAVDEGNDRLVLFGGADRSNALMNETWELPLDTVSGYRWRRLSPAGTPPTPRFGPAMVYDPVDERMIVFGGEADMVAFNDVWELSLTVGSETWRQLAPTGAPPAARRGSYAIYHPTRRSVVVFGGVDNPGPYFDDVWELHLDSLYWSEIEPAGTPPAARSDGSVAWDSTANRMLVCCGRGPELFYNDMYAMSLEPGSEAWTLVTQGGQVPSARAGTGSAVRGSGCSLFLYGGYYYSGGHVFYDDLYRLDMTTLTWERLLPSGVLPAARRHPMFACDAENERLVLLGGDNYYERFGDWWYMDITTLGVEEWQESALPYNGLGLQILSVARNRVRVRCSVPGKSRTSLRVIDSAGRIVRTLHAGMIPGDRVFAWDRTGDKGCRVASGTYYLYLQAGDVGTARKVALTD